MLVTIRPTVKPLGWFSLLQLVNLADDHERTLSYNYSHWLKYSPQKIEDERHNIDLYRGEIARRFPNWKCPRQRQWAELQAREAAK